MFRALDVEREPTFDDSITALREQTYRPYAGTTFGFNDEIRIPIRKQDNHVLPSLSAIHIRGRLTNGLQAVSTSAKLVTNFAAFLFNECRYELNGVELDRTRNLGVATTMKGYVSFKSTTNHQNAGWFPVSTDYSLWDDSTGRFHVILPLSLLLGFAEDFRTCVVGCTHELILIRSGNDNCALKTDDEGDKSSIVIDDIYWKVPSLSLSYEEQAHMLRIIQKNYPLTMAYRSWELYEQHSLPAATKWNWTIKTSSQLEKPRFVIIGFQTDRKQRKAASSQFDHCNISKIKVFLNDIYYPNEDIRVNLSERDYSDLYEMYTKFQPAYYHSEESSDAKPLLDRSQFLKLAPLTVIDCSHQNDTIASSTVDIRLEIELSSDIPPNTSLYALLLHDRVVTYKPLSGAVVVKQL